MSDNSRQCFFQTYKIWVVTMACVFFFSCSREQTYSSLDGLYTVSLPDNLFIDYTKTAKKIIKQELPQTNTKLVTLLLSKEQNKQLIYGITIPINKATRITNIVSLSKIIEDELKNNSAISEYIVQAIPEKSQIQFTATNRLGHLTTYESCLLSLTNSSIITLCARLQNAKNNTEAAQLIKNIKITIQE